MKNLNAEYVPGQPGIQLIDEDRVRVGRVYWTAWHALGVEIGDDDDEFGGPMMFPNLFAYLKPYGYELRDSAKHVISGYVAFGQQLAAAQRAD